LISDLHANLIALDAVLADVQRRGIDEVVCLGDVATLGPKPNEVIARLKQLGCRCILGNHDAFMLDPELIHTYTEAPVVVDAVEWCRQRLSAAELEFLASFAATLSLDGDGAGVYLYHGTPASHMTELLAITPAEQLDLELGAVDALVYGGGHTHLQMLRQHRGKWVVNPGSVGMPFKESVSGKAPVILPHAEYASIWVDGGQASVTLHRLALPPKELYEQAKSAADNPITPDLLACYG
jgi:putative phosphoesterase